jgi:acetyltransferase-like isoleucine patch superfamily enzyme
LGPACQIGPNEHLLDEPTTSAWLYSTHALEAMDRRNLQRTTLEADVWVGSNAVVLKGRRIGVGAVVAAGAVVTADVAPYTIVGGVPARVLGDRFDDELRSALVASSWWTLGSDAIRRALTAATDAAGDGAQRARTFLAALR